jgi:ribonuclease Y
VAAGSFISAWSISLSIMGMFAGALVDTIGIRKTMIISVVFLILSRVAFSFLTNPVLVFILAFMPLGVGFAIVAPIISVAIKRYTTKEGAALGFGLSLVYKKSLKTQWDVLGRERDHVLEEARREAEGIKKEAAVSAKDFAYQAKVESEREIKERMRELNQLDKRLRQKEETIEKKVEQFERREHEFSKKEREFQSRERGLAEKEGEVSRLVKEQRDVLEGIAKLSSEEARQELFARVEQETRYEAAKLSKRIED